MILKAGKAFRIRLPCLQKSFVVTAKWEAAKRAAYKIVYWTETVTEGFYTVNKVVNGNDTVGKSIPDGKYTVPEGYETTPVR